MEVQVLSRAQIQNSNWRYIAKQEIRSLTQVMEVHLCKAKGVLSSPGHKIIDNTSLKVLNPFMARELINSGVFKAAATRAREGIEIGLVRFEELALINAKLNRLLRPLETLSPIDGGVTKSLVRLYFTDNQRMGTSEFAEPIEAGVPDNEDKQAQSEAEIIGLIGEKIIRPDAISRRLIRDARQMGVRGNGVLGVELTPTSRRVMTGIIKDMYGSRFEQLGDLTEDF